uniref:Glycosyltransferase n=1 Tax=viral metagenome TaxID=1070528 RepID=A0A6C0ERS5_9ZZZZ
MVNVYLIGPGLKPIPPTGWGAVEAVIWDYHENLIKRGIKSTIINEPNLQQVITLCNNTMPDVIHIMYDDYIVIAPYLKCTRILYTSHYAYITHPHFATQYSYYYNNFFKKVIGYQNRVTLNVISNDIKDVYRKCGFDKRINVICNGAREDLFDFTINPTYPNKSVYIAKIEKRKGQYKYQNLPGIDFIGNYQDSDFDINNENYLGEWDKQTLYKNLTNYGNLVLLSEGEADPLVVKEGLIAGLGVVVSECASANLDLSKPFITVIPNDKLNDLQFVYRKIIENRLICIEMRQEIHQYAMDNFAWGKIIEKYIETCL